MPTHVIAPLGAIGLKKDRMAIFNVRNVMIFMLYKQGVFVIVPIINIP